MKIQPIMAEEKGMEEDESYVPEDFLFQEIFTRLSVKSLYRFCSVSKTYGSLTSSSSFLAAYRRRCRRRYILFYKPPVELQYTFYSFEIRGLDGKAFANPINYINTELRGYHYAQSINGLICFANNKRIFICNPATHERFSLPKVPPRLSCFRKQIIYFCFDPATDRYKVLKVVHEETRVYFNSYFIVTIGVDDSWRAIGHQGGLYQIAQGKSVCVNGILCCTGFSTTPEMNNDVIALFDVQHESFQTISYPKGLPTLRYKSCNLFELKGRLAMVDIDCFRMINVWVNNSMRDRDYESWTGYRIRFPDPCWNLLTLGNNYTYNINNDGEIVLAWCNLLSKYKYYILCYNMQTKKWRKSELVGLGCHQGWSEFVIEGYLENPSLLSDIFGQIGN